MLKPEEISIGQRVFYSPSLGGPEFEAEVLAAPRLLGEHTWVTAIGKLPDAYRAYVGLPKKQTVSAAALFALRSVEGGNPCLTPSASP